MVKQTIRSLIYLISFSHRYQIEIVFEIKKKKHYIKQVYIYIMTFCDLGLYEQNNNIQIMIQVIT